MAGINRNLEFIHQPDNAVLAGKKLLEDLIKEANELVSIITAALKSSKTNNKYKIPNRNLFR